MGNYFSRGTKPKQKKLKKAILAYLTEAFKVQREIEQEIRPQKVVVASSFPVHPDGGIWTGEDMEIESYRESAAGVILHFDGGANEYLSSDAGNSYADVADVHQNAISKIATELGWSTQQINCWSTGYYWEGSGYGAQVARDEKRGKDREEARVAAEKMAPIQVGDFVRSFGHAYEFATLGEDGLCLGCNQCRGWDGTGNGHVSGYVEGVVIGFPEREGCQRVQITVTAEMRQGRYSPVQIGTRVVEPPVNGTQTMFSDTYFTRGVVVIHSPWESQETKKEVSR